MKEQVRPFEAIFEKHNLSNITLKKIIIIMIYWASPRTARMVNIIKSFMYLSPLRIKAEKYLRFLK